MLYSCIICSECISCIFTELGLDEDPTCNIILSLYLSVRPVGVTIMSASCSLVSLSPEVRPSSPQSQKWLYLGPEPFLNACLSVS